MALNPRIKDWAGQVVWLVGASSGIGRATAALLHANGARVVVSARSEATLASFVSQHPGSMAITRSSTKTIQSSSCTSMTLPSTGSLSV